MPNLIKIEVTADIASKIRACAEAGVFSINTGNFQVNIANGIIKSIKTELYTYPDNGNLNGDMLSSKYDIQKGTNIHTSPQRKDEDFKVG